MSRTILLSIVAGVLAIVAIVVYLWMYVSDGDAPRSPEELERLALTASSPSEQQQAAVELASHGKAARDNLRRTYRDAKTAEVRAAAIQGLGAAYDYESVEDLFRALEDESALIRGRAGVALQKMIGADVGYRANAPPEERTKKVEYMKALWIRMRGSVLEEN